MPEVHTPPDTFLQLVYNSNRNAAALYWPQWMKHHYDSSTLFNKFCAKLHAPVQYTGYILRDLVSSINSLTISYGEPRLGWMASLPIDPAAITSVSLPEGIQENDPYMATSPFQFVDSKMPVYIVDNGVLYLRNLGNVSTGLDMCGKIEISLDEILLEDTVLIYYNGIWIQYPTKDIIISQDLAIISLPITGHVDYTYTSKSRLEQIANYGYITINQQYNVPLAQIDFWNRFDELGACLYLPRKSNEDNRSYEARLKTVYTFSLPPTESGLSVAISRAIASFNIESWSASGSLVLSNPADYILVDDYPQSSSFLIRPYTVSGVINAGFLQPSTAYVMSDSIVEQATIGQNGNLYCSLPADSVKLVHVALDLYTLQTSGDKVISITATPNNPVVPVKLGMVHGVKSRTLARKDYLNDLLEHNYSTAQEFANIIRTNTCFLLGYVPWFKTEWTTSWSIAATVDYLPEVMD